MKTGKIYISAQLASRLNLTSKAEFIKVRAGVKIVSARLIITQGKKANYLLSPALKKSLGINRKGNFRINYDEDLHMLHIGPIIGILSSFIPQQSEYNYKSTQAELIFLSKISKKLPGYIYVFTPGSINWKRKTVVGYRYQQTNKELGRWVAAIYPLPDVVYDRIASRRIENKKSIRLAKKKLNKLPYLKYFNPGFLNKWSVYKILSQNEELKKYLPETHRLSSNNLKAMLEKYDILYLKPSNGTLGRDIIKVNKKRGSSRFNYKIHKRTTVNGRAASARELMVKTRRARAKKLFIVQQGLKLSKYKGSVFDIRIIFQKNAVGDWVITKKFVRVAPRGSSIANLSRGGRAETSKKVFASLFAHNQVLINEKNQEITELCQKIATTLEEKTEKIYGELGMDLGIDTEKNLWIIEVNSKPRKTTKTDLSMGIVRNTFRRPLEYAVYLSGFARQEEN
jgi:glutathione synthase/RimK-type ligase-like ATP-grasp enzyme